MDFYVGFELTLNDKIIGKESGIKREIDISIKGIVDNIDVLCLVQCKDHKKPADIKIIDEFSSVIKDIGASKGFLICSSGFAKTIHQYARTKGIELITVEDINSAKWKTEIKIPVIYTLKEMQGSVGHIITTTQELVDRNPTGIKIITEDFMSISLNKGKNIIPLSNLINDKIKVEKIDISTVKAMYLNDINLLITLGGCWIPCEIDLKFDIKRKYFLKYVTPNEYSQIKNHLNKEFIPLKLEITNFNFTLDETYIEISEDDLSNFTSIKIELENILSNTLYVYKPEVGSKLTFEMLD